MLRNFARLLFKGTEECGDTYQLGSGSWAEEMDIYEDAFRGLTKDELGECFEKLFSDLNGRPLNGKSEAEEDVAKRESPF